MDGISLPGYLEPACYGGTEREWPLQLDVPGMKFQLYHPQSGARGEENERGLGPFQLLMLPIYFPTQIQFTRYKIHPLFF